MIGGNVLPGLVLILVQMFNGDHMWGMGWMAFWWVFIIAATVALFSYLLSATRRTPRIREESPVDILKRRYARGEIDAEAYEKTLQDLKK